jgi:hypothetical protein
VGGGQLQEMARTRAPVADARSSQHRQAQRSRLRHESSPPTLTLPLRGGGNVVSGGGNIVSGGREFFKDHYACAARWAAAAAITRTPVAKDASSMRNVGEWWAGATSASGGRAPSMK